MLVTLLLLAASIPAVQPQSQPQSLSPSQLVYTGTPDKPLQLNIQDGAVQPLLTALSGEVVVLSNVIVIASNVLGGRPVSSLDEALALPGLLNLLPGSALSINQTSIVTSCSNLLSIQAVACQLPWNSLGNLKVSPGSLWIPSWRSTSLSLRDVSVTCLSPPSWIAAARNYSGSFPGNYTVPRGSLVQPYTGQPPTPLLACAVQPVSTWTELVNTTVHLQLYALTVYIVIRANITVPYNYSSFVAGTVAVYRNLHISPDPGIARYKTVLDLGYVRGEGLWTLMPGWGTIVFKSLLFITLPLGPIDKYPMSVLPWGFWHVDFDRCGEYNGIMVALNCTLILQASTMQYISYWAGELLSPFSDHRTAAAWYGMDPTCNPPQNRTLLNQQIELVEQYTWVAQNATNLGTTLSNCLLTTRYPEGVANTLPGLPLTLLLEDPYTPFPTMSWVNNATGLIQVLMTQPTQNIILLGNISISPGLWPAGGIALKRDLVIAGWPTRDTVLDWQGASSCLLLGTYQLRLRNLVLQNGGQCKALAAAGGPDGGSEGGGGSGCNCWNANLTMYQWPLVLQRSMATPSLVMTNVELVLPPSELAILLSVNSSTYSPNTNSSTISEAQPLLWVRKATYDGTSLTCAVMADEGMRGTNITLSSQASAFSMLPIQVFLDPAALPQYPGMRPPPLPALAAPGPDPPSSQRAKWIMSIVLPVVLGSLFAAALVTLLQRRRSWRMAQEAAAAKIGSYAVPGGGHGAGGASSQGQSGSAGAHAHDDVMGMRAGGYPYPCTYSTLPDGSYYNGPHAVASGSMGEGGHGSMLEGMGVGRGGLVDAWEPAAPSLLSAPLTMQGTEDAMSMGNVHNSHACVDMGVNSAGGSSLLRTTERMRALSGPAWGAAAAAGTSADGLDPMHPAALPHPGTFPPFSHPHLNSLPPRSWRGGQGASSSQGTGRELSASEVQVAPEVQGGCLGGLLQQLLRPPPATAPHSSPPMSSHAAPGHQASLHPPHSDGAAWQHGPTHGPAHGGGVSGAPSPSLVLYPSPLALHQQQGQQQGQLQGQQQQQQGQQQPQWQQQGQQRQQGTMLGGVAAGHMLGGGQGQGQGQAPSCSGWGVAQSSPTIQAWPASHNAAMHHTNTSCPVYPNHLNHPPRGPSPPGMDPALHPQHHHSQPSMQHLLGTGGGGEGGGHSRGRSGFSQRSTSATSFPPAFQERSLTSGLGFGSPRTPHTLPALQQQQQQQEEEQQQLQQQHHSSSSLPTSLSQHSCCTCGDSSGTAGPPSGLLTHHTAQPFPLQAAGGGAPAAAAAVAGASPWFSPGGGGPLSGQRDGVPRAVGGGGGPGSSSLSQPNSGALGPAGSDASGSAGLAGWDSFDQAPLDNNQLLINCMEMSKELQSTISAPDVVAQLKSMVTQMQRELGDQEVVVTRVLGSGGSGVVYQGTWRGLTVAVKTLVFTVLPMQPMTRRQQRAMTEAAICRTLHHPNIVATYAYELQSLQALGSRQPSQVNPGACASSSSVHSNSSGGEGQGQGQGTQSVLMRGSDPPAPIESVSTATEYKLYIIQEFCNGGTLRSAVDEGMLHDMSGGTPRPVMSHILELALDIAAGMAHVHSRNIVHGDLTPANVLLRISEDKVSRFTAKVADFGLSWKLASGQEHISNARQGTGFYISPEVLHVGIMSKAADAFSFGMLLHEMYHGTPVWRRGSQGMAAAAVAAMQRPGLDQLAWSPSCSPEFKNLITDCLASDPQARPSFVRIVERLMLLQHSTMQHNNSQLTTSPTAPCPDLPSPSADVPSPPALSPPDIAAAAAAMVGAQPGARSIHAAAAAAVATAAAAGLRPGPATLAVGHTSGLSLAGYNKHGLGEALAPVAEEGEPLTPMASQRSDSIRSSASFLPPAAGDPAKCSSGELLRGGSTASTGAGGPVLDTLSSLCSSGSLGKAVGSGVLVRELSFGSRVGLVGSHSLGEPSFALGSGAALTSINLDDGASSRLQEVEGREGLDRLVGREGGGVGAGAEGGRKEGEGEGEAVGVWELGVARDLAV